MGVLLRIGRQKAILRGAEWRCALPSLEEQLNGFTRAWVHRDAQREELSGDMEAAIAQAVAAKFGGRVLLRSRPRAQAIQQRYMHLRQMSLFDD